MVPRKGSEPYFELFDKWTPTSEMPAKVYLDEPRYGCNFSWTSQLTIINREVKKKMFPCMYRCSTCRRKEAFSIAADLERHYITAHAYNQDSFPCDYRNCPRAIEPFRRKDHYREHLRAYHKEDLGTFSGDKNIKDKEREELQAAWLASRVINARDWRCSHCLIINHVDEVGGSAVLAKLRVRRAVL
jgi:hypothetical protein